MKQQLQTAWNFNNQLGLTASIERELKLIEEVGELAQAVLSKEKTKGCEYKQSTLNDVIEEATDVMLVSSTMLNSLDVEVETAVQKLATIRKTETNKTVFDIIVNLNRAVGEKEFLTAFGLAYATLVLYDVSNKRIAKELGKKIQKWKKVMGA